MSAKPFLFITLQHCAGEIFADIFAQHSRNTKLLEDPLTPDAVWGTIGQNHDRHQDPSLSEKHLRENLTDGINIMHSIDTYAPSLSRSLIAAAHHNGYQFMVMTRRDEIERMKESITVELLEDGEIPNSLSKKLLREYQEEFELVHQLTSSLLYHLKYIGIDYTWLAYEDFFNVHSDFTGKMTNTVIELDYSPKISVIQDAKPPTHPDTKKLRELKNYTQLCEMLDDVYERNMIL